VELGGTISGEHGIGVEKQEAMHMIFSSEDLDFQQDLKVAFDPQNLLNPGKVIPSSRPEEKKQAGLPAADSQVDALDELIQVVETAAKENKALLPVGCGSRKGFGNLQSSEHLLLESARLDNIIAYDPPNQVITVGAGVSLETLQRELQDHNQWLPLRPPFATMQHSLGGLAATATCGPERMVYGSVRDLVLGLRFINGKGQQISAGGRVVKNVAGYDITRLMVGSSGTLGMITEMTLKLSTIPERCCALTAVGLLNDCAEIAAQYVQSNLWPAYIVAVPLDLSDGDRLAGPWEIAIGFEGVGENVDSQLERAAGLLQERSVSSVAVQECHPIAGKFRDQYKTLDQYGFLLRADVPLDRLADLFVSVQPSLPKYYPFLDFGNGRVTLGLEMFAMSEWLDVADRASELGGHALVEKAPDDFKQEADVFGRDRSAWGIMHRLKNVLDPQHIFSPGRLPGKA
jgi:FAD/FMN-containing dehydrogenase